MATSNSVGVYSGSNFTVPVTVCNLSTDLTLKDFIVLKNGTLTSNADFTKTSSTVLTYTGVSLPALTTLEVRRRTPTSYVTGARFGSRLRSADWNNELDRITRRAEEYELNGVGAGSITTVQTPKDDPFGVVWNGDIIYPPTRGSLYNWGVTLAPTNNPTFTGVVLLPVVANSDSSSKAATTQYVQNNLTSYATLASPTFSGTPTAPTPSAGDSTQKLATTQYVNTPGTWVNLAQPSGWSNLASFPGLRYRKRSDGNLDVQWYGAASFTAGVNSNVAVMTLPVGLRPSTPLSLSGWFATGSPLAYTVGRLDVDTAGVVTLFITLAASSSFPSFVGINSVLHIT